MIDPTRVRTLVLFRESTNTRPHPRLPLNICLRSTLISSSQGLVQAEVRLATVVALMLRSSLSLALTPLLMLYQKNQLPLPGHVIIIWLCPNGHLLPRSCQEPPSAS